jgi:hypothetical protein
MTERSAGRRVRQETGWLAGGPLLLVATIRHTTDTFLFISDTMNVLLFKFCCNNFVCVRIIKEVPGLVVSGTPCSILVFFIPPLLCAHLSLCSTLSHFQSLSQGLHTAVTCYPDIWCYIAGFIDISK